MEGANIYITEMGADGVPALVAGTCQYLMLAPVELPALDDGTLKDRHHFLA
jgi:hypothetical protein